VGDTMYGAPGEMRVISNAKSTSPSSRKKREKDGAPGIGLGRNFLHSGELEFRHPSTGDMIALKSELPEELQEFLGKLQAE